MGQSHFKSNVIGFNGNEYLATFNKVQATNGIFTTANITTASANVVKASGLGDSSYVQIGAQQYIFVGNANTAATVIAEATALVATPIKGSLYLGRKGNAFYCVSDTVASPIQSLA